MPEASLIRLPEPVSRELRSQLREAFKAAIVEFDSDDSRYVDRKLDRAISRLACQDESWLSDLGKLASAMRDVRTKSSGAPECSLDGIRMIDAALFYLCEPFDLIPDHTPGRGYLDDAIVLELCVRQLRATDPLVSQWLRAILGRG